MTRLLSLLLLLAASCRPAEIVWTRMTGQTPVEAAPLVADLNRDGEKELLLVNRGGQLMLWKLDGTFVGSGQDGAIAQLPKGTWTSTPALIQSPAGLRILTVSIEGLVAALDAGFKVVWTYQLSGATLWGKTTPALLEQRMEANRRAGTKSALVAEARAALGRALQQIADLSDEAFIESRHFRAAGDRRLWHSWADVERYRRYRAEIARFTLALQ